MHFSCFHNISTVVDDVQDTDMHLWSAPPSTAEKRFAKAGLHYRFLSAMFRIFSLGLAVGFPCIVAILSLHCQSTASIACSHAAKAWFRQRILSGSN